MSFKPLKDDHQLVAALDSFSRISERCALATEAINRRVRFDPDSPLVKPGSKLMQAVETANRDRRHAKQQILALINERMSTAYSAGVNDGVSQTERR